MKILAVVGTPFKEFLGHCVLVSHKKGEIYTRTRQTLVWWRKERFLGGSLVWTFTEKGNTYRNRCMYFYTCV